MNKSAKKASIAFSCLAAVLTPVFLAILVSYWQAKEAEQARVLNYALDVLSRSEASGTQIYDGILRLWESGHDDPCSEEQLTLMRSIDLESSYIQTIGHVENGKFRCSSFGTGEEIQFQLGKPDAKLESGLTSYTNVSFPITNDTTFAVVEFLGYAAVVHKELSIDISDRDPELAVAVITPKYRQIRTQRGDIRLDWLDHQTDDPTTTFIDDGHVVAIAKSSKYPTLTLAALPIQRFQARIVNTALLLTPIGLIAGIALLWIVLRVIRQQSSMPAIIKEALQEREFFLVYQPIVSLSTGEWIGVEALIRWKRPSGEFVRPDLFIPVAEDNDLIRKITAHVIEMLARDLPEILKRKPDCHVGINLSATDMQTEDALKLLRAVADDTGAPPGSLTVEVTERGIANSEEARSIVRDFRKGGIRVAVDDFGTGYSSLSYLETFELDYLKIDKSFVDKIGTHSAASHVVLHIIEMSKGLKLEIIAEGIETEAQARFLRENGVQYGQGWMFSKPLELNDLLIGLSKPAPASIVKPETAVA